MHFQFTLPVWRATLPLIYANLRDLFSIHAPRMESDPTFNQNISLFDIFQFSLPAWRATGEKEYNEIIEKMFSILAPRMESDFCIFLLQIVLWIFNSRSPHGERRW